MVKRKKRLAKQKKGFLKQAEKHRLKIEKEVGGKDTTREYWKKEIDRYEEFAKEKTEMLKKLEKLKKQKS